MKAVPFILLFFTVNNLIGQVNTFDMNQVDLSAMVQPVPSTNQFADPDYNIWCGSVVKGKNGKYYMFYSRWPRSKGFNAWLPDSEIALAVASRPGGPYQHVKVVLPPRGRQFWDGLTTHNPAVIFYKDKYYLYYMGSTGTIEPGKPASSKWWEYRNNQRIGVAVADDPEGDWTRFDQPVLTISPDSSAYDALMVSNPAITVDQNGRAILIYKQVAKNGTLKGGKVRFGVAFAKSLSGPYIKHSKPIFEVKDKEASAAWMVAEDPFIWNYKGINYAIVRDVKGYFTNNEAALVLLRSKNAVDWKKAKFPKVISNSIAFENGEFVNEKLERPSLYLEKGRPVLLFGAVRIDHKKNAMNVAIPLK